MSRPESLVLVECNPDVSLLRELGIPRRRIRHAGGKGDICNYLRKSKNAIALMDEDPDSSQPGYLRKLAEIELNAWEAGCQIRVLEDRERGHRIVLLHPSLEEWILRAAQQNGVDVARLGLPAEGNSLHQVIAVRPSTFEELLRSLRESRELRCLRRCLEVEQLE